MKKILFMILFILMKGGKGEMVTVYVTLIIRNYKTFSQVPNNLKPAVESELYALGLDTEGMPLPEEN